MFKDYYQILEISRAATPEEIKSAYRRLSLQYHPDRNQGLNLEETTRIMQDINEAYAILKDEAKRMRYNAEYDAFLRSRYQAPKFEQQTEEHHSNAESNDFHHKWEYDYDVQDANVGEDISNARDYAQQLVKEFMASFKQAGKDAAKGAWEETKGYIWGAVGLSIIGLIIIVLCCSTNQETPSLSTLEQTPQAQTPIQEPTRVASTVSKNDSSSLQTPKNWTRYFVDNEAFSIAIPNTLEMRDKNSAYIQRVTAYGLKVDQQSVIFQQKGLDKSAPGKEDQHYCRVIVNHYECSAGDVWRRTETEPIIGETKQALREMAYSQLGPGQSMLEEPTYKWIDINSNTKAVEINYRRSAAHGNTTHGRLYLIGNYNEFVMMVVAYRESEAQLWAKDMAQVIKTFKWK